MGEEKHSRDMEDIEELREVFKVLLDFLKEVKGPLMDLIKTILDSVSGEKLAKEVSAFYKSLIESGVDEQTAKEWTAKFLDERLKTLPNLRSLTDMISGWSKTPKHQIKISEKEDKEDTR